MKRYICRLPNFAGAAPILEKFYPDTPEGHALAEKLARGWDRPGYAVYDCPNLFRDDATRRNLESVAAITCLHIDLDAKDMEESKETLRQRIEEMPYSPSVLIDSGHGYHLYFYFKEYVLADSDEAEVIRKLRAELTEFLGGDPAVNHDAALMRRPNTTNSKDMEHPVPCTVVMGELHVAV
jgi:hypothetical protein